MKVRYNTDRKSGPESGTFMQNAFFDHEDIHSIYIFIFQHCIALCRNSK